MLDLLLFPSLRTFNQLAVDLDRDGEVGFSPSTIDSCTVELEAASEPEKQELRRRGLTRDDVTGTIVPVLKVIENLSRKAPVHLVVPAREDRWRFVVAPLANSCNFTAKCRKPRTYHLLGGEAGCCTKGSGVHGAADAITDFVRDTRDLLDHVGDITIVVTPGSFEAGGYTWPRGLAAPVD